MQNFKNNSATRIHVENTFLSAVGMVNLSVRNADVQSITFCQNAIYTSAKIVAISSL